MKLKQTSCLVHGGSSILLRNPLFTSKHDQNTKQRLNTDTTDTVDTQTILGTDTWQRQRLITKQETDVNMIRKLTNLSQKTREAHGRIT